MPGNLSGLNMGLCFTCFYLLDSSSITSKFSWPVSVYLSDIGAAACVCSEGQSALLLDACTRKRTAGLIQFHLFMTFLNQQTADSSIQQV